MRPFNELFAYLIADNQVMMAKEGAIACLIFLLDSPNELIQRQSAKALANLGVNSENKQRIADEGALPRLVVLSGAPQVNVRIEAIAALANLAVNGKRLILGSGCFLAVLRILLLSVMMLWCPARRIHFVLF